MRLSISYRIVRIRGFFVGKQVLLYRKRYLGYTGPTGVGSQPQWWWRQLAGGPTASLVSGRRRWLYLRDWRYQNLGLRFLQQLSSLTEPLWPTVWATLRYLRIRHWRGWRFRLGLPAHGQRTHSNAHTTRTFKSPVSVILRSQFWSRKLWEPRKKAFKKVKSRSNSQSRRAAKAERHKRGVVRTKVAKKKDAWR